jgi:diaminopimelate decarboxylase
VNDTSQRPPGFVYRRVKKQAKGRGKSARSASSQSGAELYCEQVSLSKLAGRFDTPLYVYTSAAIRDRVKAFQHAFRNTDHTICYSVKANSNLSILRLLARLGCGFDVVSGGELERVLRASPHTKQTVFSGVGKTAGEMEVALRAGILLFNIESESELDALMRCAEKLKRKARVAFRVNPDVPAKTHPYISTGLRKHKFGVPLSAARDLYRRAANSRSLQVAGVSVHIGSQITDVAPFAAAMERVAELVRLLRTDGHRIDYVDAGGGLGIDYTSSDDCAATIEQYARAVERPLRALKVKLLLEPGRSIVGPAGALLTRVLYRKTNHGKKFLVVDAGMNDLIRPSLYQAEHQIIPVVRHNKKENDAEVVDVVGPVCESGDFFAKERRLPSAEEGELLAILDVGAYGMALASNYNTRPRPAELLVEGKSVKLTRKRETIRDLVRLET